MDGTRTGRLLLVEDEHLLRVLTAQFLRCEGYEVVEAADGCDGVGFFLSRGPFDVVLLDLNLPGISGVEVCRRIKIVDRAQPVIICSGAILDSHVDALSALQVDAFLSKPYHPSDLLKRIAAQQSGQRRARGVAPTKSLVKRSVLD
jgi:two-component system response regulator RegX3